MGGSKTQICFSLSAFVFICFSLFIYWVFVSLFISLFVYNLFICLYSCLFDRLVFVFFICLLYLFMRKVIPLTILAFSAGNQNGGKENTHLFLFVCICLCLFQFVCLFVCLFVCFLFFCLLVSLFVIILICTLMAPSHSPHTLCFSPSHLPAYLLLSLSLYLSCLCWVCPHMLLLPKLVCS